MSYGLKVYSSVRDAIAHLFIERRSVTFNFTRSHARFPAFALTSSRSNFFNFFLTFMANLPLWTDKKNIVSIFQRLTLRIPAGRPFPLFQSGPGWPSSYVYHMTTAGSLGGQLKCDSQSINQSIATENTIQLHSCLWVQT